ncbi:MULTISPECIES: hypothetical protein [unclassified Vibrio]|nr:MULTISPECIES: hypothetical protein [unclassified Vibrio]
MIEVQFWSERKGAYFCQWENGDGYLNESDLAYEETNGEEVIWNCAAAE